MTQRTTPEITVEPRGFSSVLMPALIFYGVLYGGVFAFEAFLSDKPMPDQLSLIPFILTLGNLTGESRKAVCWPVIVRACLFITLLTVSLAYCYQLAMNTTNLEYLAVFPVLAGAMMLIVAALNAVGRTRPVQWLSENLIAIGKSKWFQVPVAILLIGAAVFFFVYGEFFSGS